MTFIKRSTAAVLLTLSLAGQVQAAGYTASDYNQRLRDCVNNQLSTNRGLAVNQSLATQPKPAAQSFTTGTCLDNILNTRINIFSFGGLDGILDAIIKKVQDKACAAVMSQWNQTVGSVNQQLGGTLGGNIPLPYDLGTIQGASGGVRVGTGGSSSSGGIITYNGSAVNSGTAGQIGTQVQSGINQNTNTASKVTTAISNTFNNLIK